MLISSLLLILLLAFTANRFAIGKVCTYFDDHSQSFQQLTLVEVFNNPRKFESFESIKKCGISYIDLFEVQPPENKKYLWISYMGDSVMHELFMTAAQRFSGYMPENIEDLNLDVTGAHLGPTNPSEVPEMYHDPHKVPHFGSVNDRYESHQQQLLCCRANFVPHGKSEHDTGNCILAVKQTPFHVKWALDIHKMFVFDDIVTYIRDFVSPLYLGQFKCLSFLTAPDFAEAAYHIKQFNNNDEDEYFPSAVIMNMGLHVFNDPDPQIRKNMEKFIDIVDDGSAPIRYIMHSATAVRENNCDMPLCRNENIEQFNIIARKMLPKIHRFEAYLNLFNYSKNLLELDGYADTCRQAKVSKKECHCKRADGIHFERVCNYAPLMTQWDFNWLRELGVFITKPVV